MKVSTVEEMRQLDRRAMDEFCIPGHILMENAGQAAYFMILEELGVRDKCFVVVCGPGHNGGDGLAAYRLIAEQMRDYLNPGAIALFEIGYAQGSDVLNIFLSAGFNDVRVVKDLNGHDRVVMVSLA